MTSPDLITTDTLLTVRPSLVMTHHSRPPTEPWYPGSICAPGFSLPAATPAATGQPPSGQKASKVVQAKLNQTGSNLGGAAKTPQNASWCIGPAKQAFQRLSVSVSGRLMGSSDCPEPGGHANGAREDCSGGVIDVNPDVLLLSDLKHLPQSQVLA